MPTQAELALTAEHRQSFDTLIELLLADLDPIWRSLDPSDARGVQDELLPWMDDLVALYGPAAAELGAGWYEDMREAAGAPGAFRALPGAAPDAEATRVLTRWGTGPLFAAQPDIAATQALVEGGLQKLVADQDRASVFRSINADSTARGWSRQTTGKSCPFCIRVAARGAVFSAATADFSSHNNCDCVAIPSFAGDSRPVLPYTPAEKFRTQAQRDRNNARIAEWLATTN